MKKGKKWYKRISSFILSFLMVLQVMIGAFGTITAHAQDDADIWVGTGENIGMPWNAIYITHPKYIQFKLTMFCIEAEKEFPKENDAIQYELIKPASDDLIKKSFNKPYKSQDEALDGVKRVLWNGHPWNGSGLKEKYDVTEEEFQLITTMAMQYWTDSWWLDSQSNHIYNNNQANQIDMKRKKEGKPLLLNMFKELVGLGDYTLSSPPEDAEFLLGIPHGVEYASTYQKVLSMDLKKYPIRFIKVNENGEKISGADIKVTKLDPPFTSIAVGDDYNLHWTSDENKDGEMGYLAFGSYKFEEIKTPDGGYLNINPFEFLIQPGGKIQFKGEVPKDIEISKKNLDDGTFETIFKIRNKKDNSEYKEGKLSTVVQVDGKTSTEQEAINITPSKVKTVKDIVKYTGLVPNQQYTLTGRVMKIVDDEAVYTNHTASTKFTVDHSGNGEVELVFNDVEVEAGSTYVVFEKAESDNEFEYNDGKKKHIAKHEDKTDKSQTFNIENEKPKDDQSVIIRKYISGDTTKLLENAKLQLYKLDGDRELLVEDGEFISDSQGKEFKLTDGSYRLKEKEAPKGYKIAKDIDFIVKDNKVLIGGKEADQEIKKPYSYEAFADMNDENIMVPGNPYGKFYYVKKAGKVEVVYCFNSTKKAPSDSYDMGESIEYDPFNGGEIKYNKLKSPQDIYKYTQNPREISDNLGTKVSRIIYAGYPNKSANIDTRGLTDTQLRAGTQLAIYYYTDNADFTNEGLRNLGDGFQLLVGNEQGKKIIDYAKDLVDFSKSENAPKNIKYDFYVSNNGNYQNLIGVSHDPYDLVYVVRMEDEKDTPKPETVSIELRKIWKDFKGQDKIIGIPQATFRLTANGKPAVDINGDDVSTFIISSFDTVIVNNLPKVDKQGNTIEYVITEDSINGYTEQVELSKKTTKDQILTGKENYKLYIVNKENTPIIPELTGDLRTTVSADGKESSEKSAVVVTPKQVEEGVTITDKVDYEGLKGGEKYTLTGRLMKIVEGKEAEQVGEAKTTEFTADESGNGSVTIEFGKVKGLEAGAKYVVFENAVSKNNLIDANKDGELGEGDKKHEVKHENANDLAQTVLTKKGIEPKEKPNIPNKNNSLPKTGDNSALSFYVGLLLLSGALLLFTIDKKRKISN